MEMLQGAPSRELLRDSLALYFRFLKKNPQLVRILAWMFLEQDQDECAELDKELMAAGIAKLGEAQKAGHIRSDVDPRFVLMIFIGLAQHWFQDSQHFLQHFDGEDLSEDLDEAYLRDALKIFLGGVLPRE
jgi:TetR/AcrR family transcriptional regulator